MTTKEIQMTLTTQEETRSNFCVLVIDDDQLIIDYISILLTALRISNCIAATDGAQALAQLDNTAQRPDLIICDLVMPNMDGFEFLTQLGRRQIRIPLILMSAEAANIRQSAAFVAQLKSLYFIGELAKPIVPAQLHALMMEVLK
jgi:two-component system response regulator CpxR